MRSSTKPSEARPSRAKRGAARSAAGAVRRPGAEGDPRAARGPPSKARMRINCRDQAAAYKLPWSAGKRALHERDLVNMGLRYGKSKGARVSRQEEPPLGSLAVTCHLEESASHHFQKTCSGFNIPRKIQEP